MNMQQAPRSIGSGEQETDKCARKLLFELAANLTARQEWAARVMKVVEFLREQGLPKQAQELEEQVRARILYPAKFDEQASLDVKVPVGSISDHKTATREFRAIQMCLPTDGSGGYSTAGETIKPLLQAGADATRQRRWGLGSSTTATFRNQVVARIAKMLSREQAQTVKDILLLQVSTSGGDSTVWTLERPQPIVDRELQDDALGRQLSLLEYHVFCSASAQGLSQVASMAIRRGDIQNYEKGLLAASGSRQQRVPYFVGMMWFYGANPEYFCQVCALCMLARVLCGLSLR